MTREERKMIQLVRESDVIDFTDGSELATAAKYLFDVAIKTLEQEPCEDVVSRQAVKKALRNRIEESISDCINALPSVTPTQKWIPVSERLPEKNMACLVSVGKFHITQIAMYSDLMQTIDHKTFHQGNYGKKGFKDITEYVTAWMPLPTPYKAEMESDT